MALEPSPKWAIVFFDGQNLYHAARHAFGYTYPNFDPIALASAISNAHGWELSEVRFFTGVPDHEDDPFWHHFWTNKLAHLGRRGATIYSLFAASDLSRQEHKTWQFSPSGALGGPLSAGSAGAWTRFRSESGLGCQSAIRC